ncbi:MAG: elongation factor G [Bacteroidetes bacterium]|nr:elongation factor G [Bacteroidota bacterium]
MKAYDEKHIKNIALVGGAKTGKTTLAETMLFEAGLINRRGSVEDKNTISDFHEIEHERGNSVYATSLHTEWRDYKINLIDTPGLDDFIGEVLSAVRVCDTAVMLLNAQHGVEVGAELIWNYVDEYKKPTIFAVNQLDHEYSDFNSTVEQAKARFGKQVTIMQYPINQGIGFDSIIDLLKMTMYKFPKGGGKPEKLPIPESEMERANQLHNELVERAAENDEKLMELYFEKGNLDEDEMRVGIKKGMMNHDIFPVFCLSAKQNMGSGRLMGFIDNVAPSAIEMPFEKTIDEKEIPCNPSGPTVLFVFKTLVEPHLGKLTFFKVLSGEVVVGMELNNSNTNTTERIGQLFIMDGKNRNPIERLKAGDIGSTLKLKNTQTNHTLHGKGIEVQIKPIEFPLPRIRTAIVAKNKTDDEKLSEVLSEIHMEDPTLIVSYERETKQVLLLGQGELHLAVTKWRLAHIYKMEIEFEKPRIPYRETILKSANASYKHKKQSGGAGQFGEVYIKIEPLFDGQPLKSEYQVRDKEEVQLPWGGKLVFNNCITGGVIDSRFIPSIMKGVMDKMNVGPLTGSYVRDIAVSVYDGKMHPVDSNDISFKIAGMMAFRDAFHQAEPQLLEPIYDVEIEMPEELMGDVMSELQSRRSVITGMDSRGGYQVIKAKTPLAELDKSSVSLRSITQGRARIKSVFSEYLPVPPELQKKLAEDYHKNIRQDD